LEEAVIARLFDLCGEEKNARLNVTLVQGILRAIVDLRPRGGFFALFEDAWLAGGGGGAAGSRCGLRRLFRTAFRRGLAGSLKGEVGEDEGDSASLEKVLYEVGLTV